MDCYLHLGQTINSNLLSFVIIHLVLQPKFPGRTICCCDKCDFEFVCWLLILECESPIADDCRFSNWFPLLLLLVLLRIGWLARAVFSVRLCDCCWWEASLDWLDVDEAAWSVLSWSTLLRLETINRYGNAQFQNSEPLPPSRNAP